MSKFLLILLKGIARLPFWALYCISDFIYLVLYHFVGYRKKIVRKNLSEAFPGKDASELHKIEKEFYHYLGDQIMETVKLFHISDKELAKRVKVVNPEIVNETLKQGKNSVLLLGHYNNWEWVQEIVHYFIPGVYMASIYHPIKDKFWDDAFIQLRSHWKAHIVSQAAAPRVLLNRENFPWVCGFIADQRPGQRTKENCVEFLHHPTFFIYGPEVIANKVDADFFYLEMLRLKRGFYTITYHRLEPTKTSEPYPYTRAFWKNFEKTIESAPPYWLWSHNRWKYTSTD